MSDAHKESLIVMAIEELKNGRVKNAHAAAIVFDIPYSTLRDRLSGKTWKGEAATNSMLFTVIEEESIVKYILDLDSKGYPARYDDVAAMAQSILDLRLSTRTLQIGKQWPYRFVRRRPEIKTRMSRGLDYKRAKMEDIPIMQKWFTVIEGTIAQYNIQPSDMYNFDKTGFMMGIVKGFYIITRADRQGTGRHVQPGNRDWVTVIACISGDGWTLPPLIIFKGKYVLST